jgi:heme A synthase
VIPREPKLETLIELSHRLSSGLLGILVVTFNVLAFRVLPPGHRTRRFAFVSLLLVVAEALIGAGLVRFEWVASNASVARVYVMALHLVNTFLLLAAMTLAAWFAGEDRAPRPPGFDGIAFSMGAALFAVVVTGANGAVTALGDTLVLTQGVGPEESPLVAKLVASRYYHPTMAIAAFALVVFVVLSLRQRLGEPARRRGVFVLVLFAAQLALGALNVLLKAPVWMQLVHLGVADLLWILLVLMAVEALVPARESSPSAIL